MKRDDFLRASERLRQAAGDTSESAQAWSNAMATARGDDALDESARAYAADVSVAALAAVMRLLNADPVRLLRENLDEAVYEAMCERIAEEYAWPFEWQVASRLKAERDALREQLAKAPSLIAEQNARLSAERDAAKRELERMCADVRTAIGNSDFDHLPVAEAVRVQVKMLSAALAATERDGED